MRIKIMSDSTCDLPQALLQSHDITLVPLTVVKDDKDYKDGADITPADIFAHVAAGGSLCSTSAVSVGEYEEYFKKYSGEYDAVIHINIGSGFSSSYQNALVAAEEFDNVRCVDSMNLSVGQGMVVLKASQLAENCNDLATLCAQLADFIPRVEISFVLDQLQYMAKGGRCSAATALGANLLNLKPCIEVKDGKMGVVKKYRGNYIKCLTTYIQDRLSERSDIETGLMSLVYTCDAGDSVLEPVRKAIGESCHFDESFEAVAGCTISCHCGPGTLGLAYVRK